MKLSSQEQNTLLYSLSQTLTLSEQFGDKELMKQLTELEDKLTREFMKN